MKNRYHILLRSLKTLGSCHWTSLLFIFTNSELFQVKNAVCDKGLFHNYVDKFCHFLPPTPPPLSVPFRELLSKCSILEPSLVNPISTRGSDYFHHCSLAPSLSRLSDLSTSLKCIFNLWVCEDTSQQACLWNVKSAKVSSGPNFLRKLSIPVTSSSYVFTNPESRKPDFFP